MEKRVKPLEPPDSIHLKAAEGWLELGNHIEANEELEQIAPLLRAHPDVLEVRWQIYAKEKKWRPCVDIATAITRLAPGRPVGWIHRSYALHELKRTQEAWDNLLQVADRFPNELLIRYNLACYASRLGKLSEAKAWLHKAFEVSGDPARVKLMALDDEDLQPLWRKIGEL